MYNKIHNHSIYTQIVKINTFFKNINFFSFVVLYTKMAQENIRFYEYSDESYSLVDLYLSDA